MSTTKEVEAPTPKPNEAAVSGGDKTRGGREMSAEKDKNNQKESAGRGREEELRPPPERMRRAAPIRPSRSAHPMTPGGPPRRHTPET